MKPKPYRILFNALRVALEKIPKSRAQSLALTKLDECVLWSAVALEPGIEHPLQLPDTSESKS